MRVTAREQAVAPLRTFATTLYYGIGDLTDQVDEDDIALKKYALIAPCIEDGVSQTDRALEIGISRRNLCRLIQRFESGGIEALRRKERADKGRARVSVNTLTFIKGKILSNPKLSFATIQRQLRRLGTHAEEFSATYQQIRRVRKNMSEDLVVLARSEKEFEETRELLFRHEAVFPNELWQCDHKFLDIFVWDDSKNPVKPVLTAVIDDYSRSIMGYYLDLDPPSAQRTAIALRQAIWHKDNDEWLVCGIPDRLYTDRGSDFRSNRIKQVAAELGIKLSKGRSNKPQGRGKIERFFGSVNQLLMSELPGYTAEDQPPATPGMTLQQLQLLFYEWLIAEYMHRVHSELNETPFARWKNHHQHPRLAPSLESLNVLLMTVPDNRIVQQNGIRIFNHSYIADQFHGLVDRHVTARYDPRDISEVLVYLDNKFLCRATCPELAAQKPALKEHMKARAEYRRLLKKDISTAVTFAESCDQANRKLPSPPLSSALPATRISKFRRYKTDE